MDDKPKSYKDLIVWQKEMDLVDEVYTITRKLPQIENYILIAQMLRAAISIPSNIAEGWRRKSRAEYKHHLTISLGSAGELETQLLITKRQYTTIDVTQALALAEEAQKMLNSMTSDYNL